MNRWSEAENSTIADEAVRSTCERVFSLVVVLWRVYCNARISLAYIKDATHLKGHKANRILLLQNKMI